MTVTSGAVAAATFLSRILGFLRETAYSGFYGDTAVVTGLDHLGGTYMGNYGEMYLRFTDVLVKRDGRWQLVIQQATRAEGGG